MRQISYVFGLVVACALGIAACDDAGDIDVPLADIGLADAHVRVDQAAPQGAVVETPRYVRLPYVIEGAGGAQVSLRLTNTGDAAASLGLTLSGDPTLTLDRTAVAIPAGEFVDVVVSFAGATTPLIALGELVVRFPDGRTQSVHVAAVAGPADLPSATFEPVLSADGRRCGVGATIAMPSAPFPGQQRDLDGSERPRLRA